MSHRLQCRTMLSSWRGKAYLIVTPAPLPSSACQTGEFGTFAPNFYPGYLGTQLLGCPFLRRLVLVVPLFWKASTSNPFPTLLTLTIRHITPASHPAHDASNNPPTWWSLRLEASSRDVVWEDHRRQASQVSPPHGAFRSLASTRPFHNDAAAGKARLDSTKLSYSIRKILRDTIKGISASLLVLGSSRMAAGPLMCLHGGARPDIR